MTNSNQAFIKKLNQFIEKNLDKPDFSSGNIFLELGIVFSPNFESRKGSIFKNGDKKL